MSTSEPGVFVMTAYPALIRPSREDAMGRGCILDSHPGRWMPAAVQMPSVVRMPACQGREANRRRHRLTELTTKALGHFFPFWTPIVGECITHCKRYVGDADPTSCIVHKKRYCAEPCENNYFGNFWHFSLLNSPLPSLHCLLEPCNRICFAFLAEKWWWWWGGSTQTPVLKHLCTMHVHCSPSLQMQVCSSGNHR